MKTIGDKTLPIILGYDEENDILCNLMLNSFIDLESLLFISEKIQRTIEFTRNNNIQELNNRNIETECSCIVKVKKNKIKHTKLYVMLDRNTGLYKIGRSKNPIGRERTLQSEKPVIDMVFNFAATNKDEKKLHDLFIEKRVRGEWFSLSNEDIEFIKMYLIK